MTLNCADIAKLKNAFLATSACVKLKCETTHKKKTEVIIIWVLILLFFCFINILCVLFILNCKTHEKLFGLCFFCCCAARLVKNKKIIQFFFMIEFTTKRSALKIDYELQNNKMRYKMLWIILFCCFCCWYLIQFLINSFCFWCLKDPVVEKLMQLRN